MMMQMYAKKKKQTKNEHRVIQNEKKDHKET